MKINSIILFISLLICSCATDINNPGDNVTTGQIVPTIAYPTGGELVYSNPVKFVWSSEGISTGYKYNIQVSFYSDFRSIYLNQDDLPGFNYSFPVIPGIHYYWRIRSKVNNSYSGWAQAHFISAG